MFHACDIRFDVTGNLENFLVFRCEIFLDFATVALSFVYGKYYLIMN